MILTSLILDSVIQHILLNFTISYNFTYRLGIVISCRII
nr:MAG TPA: hypothetical protein [Caudoviricetes sp.]